MATVLKDLLTNLKTYLNNNGIQYPNSAQTSSLEDPETIAMFLRLRVKPIIGNISALEQLIPKEYLTQLNQEQKTKCHRFLTAMCDLV